MRGVHNLLASLALVAMTGCNMTKLAVNTQAKVMEQASPVVEEQTDYEFARAAAPASLIQVEGLLRVQPEDERLLLLGARGFAAYSFAFIEDEKERAEQRGDLEQADVERARARNMYLKAKGFGVRLLELKQPGFVAAMQRDPDTMQRFLRAEFADPEDVPALFWTGYAWGSAIGVARDDPSLLADIPFASALVERSVELDERYYNAAGHVFLGVVDASRSKSVGGDPEKGRQHFEKALALTERQALVVQLKYAETYAVQEQNRELFLALLQEILSAPAPKKVHLSLANTIARRRAQRLLSQADSLILETLEAPAPQPTQPTAPQAEPTQPEPTKEK
jgi:hypothetical protein